MRTSFAVLTLLAGLAVAQDDAPDPKLVAAVKAYLGAADSGARDEAAKGLVPFDAVHVDGLSAALRAAVTWPAVEGPIQKKLTIKKGEITYVAHLPKGYDPAKAYGLLYFIYGHGTDASGAFEVWSPEKLGDAYVVASVSMPADDPRYPGWPDYDTADLTFEAVLNDLLHAVHIDPDRVFVGGWSMGANFAWATAAFQSDRLAGVIAGSGREPDGTTPDCMRNMMWCPAYAICGTEETESPMPIARALVKKLRDYGYSVVFKEIEGMGHAWSAELEPDIFEWMQKKTRVRDPKKLYHSLRWWGRPNRRFCWETPLKGDVRATLEAGIQGNTISLQTKILTQVLLDLNDRLVNLDGEVTVEANGTRVFKGKVERSARIALDEFRERGDLEDLHDAHLIMNIQ